MQLGVVYVIRVEISEHNVAGDLRASSEESLKAQRDCHIASTRPGSRDSLSVEQIFNKRAGLLGQYYIREKYSVM